MTDAKNMALLACEALEDKKASDIKVIDIEQITTLADYFIIASGSNRNQVQAMADNVDEVLGKAGYPCKQTEGYSSANWILLDYGDIVIHLFDEENRLFYDLESDGCEGTERRAVGTSKEGTEIDFDFCTLFLFISFQFYVSSDSLLHKSIYTNHFTKNL